MFEFTSKVGCQYVGWGLDNGKNSRDTYVNLFVVSYMLARLITKKLKTKTAKGSLKLKIKHFIAKCALACLCQRKRQDEYVQRRADINSRVMLHNRQKFKRYH